MIVKQLIVEFIGTFFLVFTIGQCVMEPGAGDLAPLAIGSALMVMVYAGGHISGGHYNPAVTLAVTIRGKSPIWKAPLYWAVQCGGAAVAALTTLYLKGTTAVTPLAPEVGPSILVEALFTFALCYVVLNVATAAKTAGNSFYGLAIGFTVLTGAFAVGGISGGAFNPAVAVGLGVLHKLNWTDLWIYLAADLGAAVVAAIIFLLVDPREPEPVA